MLSAIKELLGLPSNTQAEQDALPMMAPMAANEGNAMQALLAEQAAAQQAAVEEQAMAAQAAQAAAAETAQNEFDLVAGANQVLANLLSKTRVQQYAPGGQLLPAIGWLKDVQIGKPLAENVGIAGPASRYTQITLTLAKDSGNYDIDSISNVLHAILAKVPGLEGHVRPAPDAKEAEKTMGDAWKDLEPVLRQSAKFNAQEMKILTGYFMDNKTRETTWGSWDRIKVGNADKKVQMKINAEPTAEDSKAVLSTDQSIVDFITTNKAGLLQHFKAKLLALKDDKGQPLLNETQLATLDFTAEIRKNEGGWPESLPVVEFGNLVDGKLAETPIHAINTEVLDEAFTLALSECQGHLAEIFPRIADSATVAKIIRARVGQSPALDKALDHNAFRSREENDLRSKADEKNNIVTLENVQPVAAPDGSFTVKMGLSLPEGMDVTKLRYNLLQAQQQLLLATQPRGMAREA